MGQDLHGDCAGSWHDGRLEADRRHRRRKDWQDPSDLRPGRGGGNHRGGDDRRGRWLRPASVDDPRSVVRRRRDDDGQWFGNAMVDHPQHCACLGPDPTGGDDYVRRAIRSLPPDFLTASATASLNAQRRLISAALTYATSPVLNAQPSSAAPLLTGREWD